MRIKVDRWNGAWRQVEAEVVRVTKTMVVIKWGNGEERFNRKRGRLVGGFKSGFESMTEPHINYEELAEFEKLYAAKQEGE